VRERLTLFSRRQGIW